MTPHHRHVNKRRPSDQDTTSLLNKDTDKKILRWDELPAWMQDNHYITGNYRRPTGSYVGCLKTIFYLHNEYGKKKKKSQKEWWVVVVVIQY